jgi:ABC-type multidrug transport system ATPase subunit
LVCEQLTKTYRGTVAVSDVSLAISEGEILALLGPNGCGKTTTTRLLATLTRADRGSARVAGHDVAREPERVRRAIGLTAQETALDGFLTGVEYLDFAGRMHRIARAERRRRVRRLLVEFELEDAARRRIGTYSGGMRRRLDIAGSLISDPAVLFLDEPSSGLDPHSRARLWGTVRARAAEGMTILLTTQYMDEAEALADAVVVLVEGRVAASGAPHEIKDRVGGRVAELAIGGDADDPAVERAVLAVSDKAERAGDPHCWTVPLPDSSAATLQSLIERLQRVGVEPVDISVRAPTLDEAFRTITRNAARGEPDPGAEPAPAESR